MSSNPTAKSRRRRRVVKTTTTQVTNQNNSAPRRRRRNRRRGKRAVATKLSPRAIAKCAQEYGVALVNPFGLRSTLPCIPDVSVMPSYKFQVKARGVFSTGTLGVGFIILDPFMMMWNNGIPNVPTESNTAPVVFTTPTYAGTTIGYLPSEDGLPTGVEIGQSNSMFDSAFYSNTTRKIRLVASGLRISYVGSNFRNQGRITIYRNQGNESIVNGTTNSTMLKDNYTSICPISRKSEYVFYTPDNAEHLSYLSGRDHFDPNSGAPDAADHHCMAIFIEGGDTENPQSWLFEAISYFEMIGPNLTLSPSHSDPVGMGTVLSSLPVKAPTSTPPVVAESLMNRVGQTLLEQFGNVAVGLAGALPSYLANQGLRYMGGAPSNQLVSIEEI